MLFVLSSVSVSLGQSTTEEIIAAAKKESRSAAYTNELFDGLRLDYTRQCQGESSSLIFRQASREMYRLDSETKSLGLFKGFAYLAERADRGNYAIKSGFDDALVKEVAFDLHGNLPVVGVSSFMHRLESYDFDNVTLEKSAAGQVVQAIDFSDEAGHYGTLKWLPDEMYRLLEYRESFGDPNGKLITIHDVIDRPGQVPGPGEKVELRSLKIKYEERDGRVVPVEYVEGLGTAAMVFKLTNVQPLDVDLEFFDPAISLGLEIPKPPLFPSWASCLR